MYLFNYLEDFGFAASAEQSCGHISSIFKYLGVLLIFLAFAAINLSDSL